jgi:predicted Zn-dependent protease
VLEPGRDDVRFEDLVKDTSRGIAVISGKVQTDFQQRNGSVWGGEVREIVNGKLGDALIGLELLFNTTELWKNVMALGGAGSQERGAGRSTKGEPEQTTDFTVHAVPAKLKALAFVELTRKA